MYFLNTQKKKKVNDTRSFYLDYHTKNDLNLIVQTWKRYECECCSNSELDLAYDLGVKC